MEKEHPPHYKTGVWSYSTSSRLRLVLFLIFLCSRSFFHHSLSRCRLIRIDVHQPPAAAFDKGIPQPDQAAENRKPDQPENGGEERETITTTAVGTATAKIVTVIEAVVSVVLQT